MELLFYALPTRSVLALHATSEVHQKVVNAWWITIFGTDDDGQNARIGVNSVQLLN